MCSSWPETSCPDAEDLAWIIAPVRCPVVWILGNHEWYRRRLSLSDPRSAAHAAMAATVRERWGKPLHLLQDEVLDLPGGWRVVGTTWWPAMDWTNDAGVPNYTPGHLLDLTHDAIHHQIADFRCITVERARPGAVPSFGKARVDDLIALHRRQHRWLMATIAAGDPRRTIVATHYVPTVLGIADEFRASELNCYFVNAHLDRHPSEVPLWVCGHTHASIDVQVGATRVIANPAGYGFENDAFRATWSVEIS